MRCWARPDLSGAASRRRRADVRALGAFRGPVAFGPVPFDTSLTAESRRQIVQLTANFHLPVPDGEFTPEPLAARRLELTALGANAELEGRWDYPLVAPGAARAAAGL